MAKRMTREKRLLYDRFRRNHAIHNRASRRPSCPVCGRSLHFEDASVAHVLPESTGLEEGMVLECKDCNARLGGFADEQFARQILIFRFNTCGLPADRLAALINCRRGVVDGRTGRIRNAEAEGNRVRAQIDFGGVLADDLVAKRTSTIALEGPDRAAARVGLLHSALLQMFAQLGYEYVNHPNVRDIRRDLTWATCVGRSPAATAQRFEKYRHTIYIVEASCFWEGLHVGIGTGGLLCFAALFPVRQTEALVVLLPGFGKSGASAYERACVKAFHSSMHLQPVIPAPAADRLTDWRHKDCGRRIWRLFDPLHGGIGPTIRSLMRRAVVQNACLPVLFDLARGRQTAA